MARFPQELSSPQPLATPQLVSRIATGSCTAYDIRQQPVWEQVKIKTKTLKPDRVPEGTEEYTSVSRSSV